MSLPRNKIYSISELARLLGWPPGRVRRFLARLEVQPFALSTYTPKRGRTKGKPQASKHYITLSQLSERFRDDFESLSIGAKNKRGS